MFKALIKKQMLEFFSFITMDRRKGERRSTGGIVFTALLYLFIFGFMGYSFYMIMSELCEPLFQAGLGWMFFTVASLIALFFGVIGSVMATYSAMYAAKDNDLLLSLPLKPGHIVVSRLLGVYLLSLLFVIVCMTPALIVYFVRIKPNALSTVLSVLMPFVLSFIVLFFSCLLGWLVGMIVKRIKRKNVFTVVLSLVFVAAYYFFYMRALDALPTFAANAGKSADGFRTWLYPLYLLGRGATGDVVSMLIAIGITAVLCLLAYLVISRSFYSIANGSKQTESGAVFTSGKSAGRARSLEHALLFRELKRFSSSSMYMLNSGFGVVIMIAAAVALFIKGGDLVGLASMLGFEHGILSLFGCAACIMLASSCMITAPSVSLEGKQIDVVRSLPVPAKKVLDAKLLLHQVITLLPLLLLIVAVEIVFKPDPVCAVLIPLVSLSANLFLSEFGLMLNLRFPNLHWVNETVPIKQSIPVAIAMFMGFAVVIVLGLIYLLFSGSLSPAVYLSLVFVLFAAASFALYKWISGRGAKRFMQID